MRKIFYGILMSFLFLNLFAQNNNEYDLVIVGGTPGGIMSAIAASRNGKTSVILERSRFTGGLPVNGLGATDINTHGATTGLFKEFVDGVLSYYIKMYGPNSKQVKICSDGYHFEPHVAGIVFNQMIDAEKKNITVLTMRQFDALEKNVKKENNTIKSITVLNRDTNKKEVYSGKMFIDATYEGDLGAAAGVPFSVGREGEDEYNEIAAGRIFKLWGGYEVEGTTHEADNTVQAYNYRLCLTDDAENRLLPSKPKGYKRSDYISLIDDVYLGRHTGVEILGVTPEMREENKKRVMAGYETTIPGDPWGIAKITNMVALPNQKTDANNQHMALISTDLPEENWKWPTADWKWRDRFAERLKKYTIGLLWFAQNDTDLPETFRKECLEWGLAKDEYKENDNFPRQVYVREGRRFNGVHFFTANDTRVVEGTERPPIFRNSITASHYNLDSHAVRKREEGKLALDGFFSCLSDPYMVPYGVILPKNIENLIIPISASATHVGFSTLRMEPCWMALGQAAGTAASIAIDSEKSVQNVDTETLQNKLLKEKVTLIYFQDVTVDSPDFEMVQYMGVRGYITGFDANLDNIISEATAEEWSKLSGYKFNYKNKTRIDILRGIYQLTK